MKTIERISVISLILLIAWIFIPKSALSPGEVMENEQQTTIDTATGRSATIGLSIDTTGYFVTGSSSGGSGLKRNPVEGYLPANMKETGNQNFYMGRSNRTRANHNIGIGHRTRSNYNANNKTENEQ